MKNHKNHEDSCNKIPKETTKMWETPEHGVFGGYVSGLCTLRIMPKPKCSHLRIV